VIRTAVLLANMGGPEGLTEVEPYLRTIFSDPAILPVPAGLRPSVAKWLARRRTPKVQRRYWTIGGGSPLPFWTRAQTALLAHRLAASAPELAVSFAFRYSPPTLEQRLTELRSHGARRVLVLPLFPHRTEAMTGSIETVAQRVVAQTDCTVFCLDAWSDRADVLRLWESRLHAAVTEAGRGARVLFVAHGIPMRNVRQGDDYPQQVAATATSLGRTLAPGNPWSLAYQSRLGPIRWTEPYLEDELARLSQSSAPLVLMPLSFVADCLETIYDLDVVAIGQARAAGIKRIVRTAVFNDDPLFSDIIANMINEKLDELREN